MERSGIPVRFIGLIMIEASPSAYPRGMLAVGKATHARGGDLRRFSTTPHPYDGGVDLQARSLYVCIVTHAGEILVHRHLSAAPEPVRQAGAPYRDGRGVAVECRVTWDWLAARCAQEHRPCVRGPALSLKALHGGKATHDQLASPKLAALLRGGLLPQASGSPAEMRATRALLRRRPPLRRKRAALVAHVQHPNRPDALPASGQKSAYQAHRAGVAARVAEPAAPKRRAGDLALIPSDAQRPGARALSLLRAATHHDANTLALVPTVPGMGQILSLVRRYAIHDMARFPRGQAFVASGRLVTCAQASAGQRSGPSGNQIGHGHLPWALAEAAVLCWRTTPAGQTYWAHVENTHGTGTALTGLAHKLARAVYARRQRPTAADLDQFLHGEGSSAGAPDASRATPGISLSQACSGAWWPASWNAKVRIGVLTQSPRR
jgi:hypothetical protein